MAQAMISLNELRNEANAIKQHAAALENDEPFGGFSVVVLCDRALQLLDLAAGIEFSENHQRANQMVSHARELYAVFNPGNNVVVNGFHIASPFESLDDLTEIVETIFENLQLAGHANEAPLYLVETIRILCTCTQDRIDRADGIENSFEHRQATKLAADASFFYERWRQFHQQQ